MGKVSIAISFSVVDGEIIWMMGRMKPRQSYLGLTDRAPDGTLFRMYSFLLISAQTRF